MKKTIWMRKAPTMTFYTDPFSSGGEAGIYEDGFVFLYYDGIKAHSEKFKSQASAIDYLFSKGWKLDKKPSFLSHNDQ